MGSHKRSQAPYCSREALAVLMCSVLQSKLQIRQGTFTTQTPDWHFHIYVSLLNIMSKRPDDRTSHPDFASFLNSELARKRLKDKEEVHVVSQLSKEHPGRREVPEMALLENPWRKLEKDPWTQEVKGKTVIEKKTKY